MARSGNRHCVVDLLLPRAESRRHRWRSRRPGETSPPLSETLFNDAAPDAPVSNEPGPTQPPAAPSPPDNNNSPPPATSALAELESCFTQSTNHAIAKIAKNARKSLTFLKPTPG